MNDGERLFLCRILIEQDNFYNKLTPKCKMTQHNRLVLAHITGQMNGLVKWLISMKSFRAPGLQRCSYLQHVASKITLRLTPFLEREGDKHGRWLVGCFSGPAESGAQTHLRDIARSVPDPHKKATTSIRQVTHMFWFPSAYKSYVYIL